MTFRSLTLSALLTLSLIANILAKPICGKVAGRLVCYNYSRKEIEAIVRETAERLGIDPELALKLAKEESNLNPLAYSSKGAIGVMQLLPETARMLGADPLDVKQNIEGGLRYFKMLLDRYGDEKLAVAAYNAGPGAVEKYGGVPPYRETRRLVKSVARKGEEEEGGLRVIHLPDGTILITNLPPELIR